MLPSFHPDWQLLLTSFFRPPRPPPHKLQSEKSSPGALKAPATMPLTSRFLRGCSCLGAPTNLLEERQEGASPAAHRPSKQASSGGSGHGNRHRCHLCRPQPP